MVLGFLSTTRDILIVLWALLSVIALVFIILATWAIYSGVRNLINVTKATMNEDVKPILSISQDSVNNVAGTARFVSDTVAKPLIRALSFIAGVRRALAVFTGLVNRRG
jgi:K+ transporter